MNDTPNALAAALVGNDPFIDAHAYSHRGVQIPCCGCKRPVWLAPSSQRLRAANPLLAVLCHDCVTERFGGNYIPVLAPGTLPELTELSRAETERN